MWQGGGRRVRSAAGAVMAVAIALAGCWGGAQQTGGTLPPGETLPGGTVPGEGTIPPGGTIPPLYLDAALPVEERVDDLLARMTLAEKIGQMTQVEKNSINPADITGLYIGSLLSGGGGSPSPNTPEAWLEMVNGFQMRALATRLGIPLIYGVDAVHGHNNVVGATIFPHAIGLGAANDPELMRRIGVATATEVAATGVQWNFAPVVAVPQDIRWGRTYEGFSENTERVTELATAYLRGLQGDALAADAGRAAVLGAPKHYIGDGGTAWGSSTTSGYRIDQGVTEVDEATLRAIHLPPYEAAIKAGAASIMLSFSSWGDLKMHAQRYLVTDVLKDELGFDGFVVSDWQGIDQIPGDYYSDVVTSINAGLDMVMVPYDYKTFIDSLTVAASRGDVPMERIDDAVRRILRVKFELGLFERPLADGSGLGMVGSAAHRELAREAAARSAVLLKNEGGALPLPTDAPLVLVGGEGGDDIGMQSGGWTIEWQGKMGDITPGTTILEAVQAAVEPGAEVRYDRAGRFDLSGGPAPVGIAVVGEKPYAEGQGDAANPALSEADIALIERMREQSDVLVVVLLSGRPLVITEQLGLADAWVAAWLPGTEGAGVADVLFGAKEFSGTLPYSWPRSAAQLPFDFAAMPTVGCDAPLFAYDYGLTTANTGALDLPVCP